MILSELVDSFLTEYKLETIKRNVPQIDLAPKLMAYLLSVAVNDIQKNFGVIELSSTVSLIAGTDKYNLTSSTMSIKKVMIGDQELTQKSTEYLESQPSTNSTPTYYSILYSAAIPKLWVYPNPVNADTLTVYFTSNYNLYSVSGVTAQDFGSFDGKSFTGNTVFPTQYDKLLILGMLKQLFRDIEADYLKEQRVLKARQFNGESLATYKMTGVI